MCNENNNNPISHFFKNNEYIIYDSNNGENKKAINFLIKSAVLNGTC